MNGRQRLYYNIYIYIFQQLFIVILRGCGLSRIYSCSPTAIVEVLVLDIAGYSVYNDRQDSLGPGTLIGSAPLYTPLITPSNRVANSRQIAC